MKAVIKPGLKGDPCSEGNAHEKGHRRSPAPGVYLHFLSLCFDRRYLNSSWGDNWCHWCQLQLAHNKPTPVWGQSLAGAVPPAWATFLPQNSSCSLPTSGALVDARTIPAAGALPSFLHQILPLPVPTSTKLRAQCWNSSSGSSRLAQHSSLSQGFV